jgi:hypothetical protein
MCRVEGPPHGGMVGAKGAGLGPGLRDGMRARRGCVREGALRDGALREGALREGALREGACVGSAAEAAAAEVRGWHALKRCGLRSSWCGSAGF